MSVRVGCPYCNHRVTLPALPEGGRAVCDRCGETFPVTGAVEDIADDAATEASDGVQPRRATGLGWYALAGLAAAAVLLAVGLSVVRQDPPPEPPVLPPAAGPVTWPPPAVPLLKHLPPDAGLAFALQPGPLLAFAERTDADPQALLAGAGVPDRVFTTLAQLGLTLDGIDQLAGGLVFPADTAFPRAVLALKPAPPATVEGLLPKLKAERDRTAGGRQRYRADLGGLPVRLETRDAGVLVVATADADLDRPPATGGAHLPAGLRETLAKLSPSAFAWAATDAADWADKPTTKAALLLLKRPDLADKLKLGRAAGAGLSLEPTLRVTAAVKAAGDPQQFQDRIAQAVAGRDVLVGGGDGWTTLELNPADLPALLGR